MHAVKTTNQESCVISGFRREVNENRYGTHRLSRNVFKELPNWLRNNPKERSSQPEKLMN
jgi:hypothetical protein